VGWDLHDHETAEHAAMLIQRICADTGVDPTGLVLHSDNGKPMRGGTMIATLQWLGIVPSFSRPHVCNDNPYSEALFRTLKHTPAYPRLPFASSDAARRWVE
jgi:putative transposase